MARIRPMTTTDDHEAISRAAPPELNEAGFEPGDIQVVTEDQATIQAKEAKFMEELVEIEIEPGTEPNDPMFIQIGHNGIMQTVLRGRVQAVKRKYLYSALMAKKVSMACTFAIGRDGSEINKLTPSAATAYRASLVSDPNPQGGTRWVQRVMAESHGVRAA